MRTPTTSSQGFTISELLVIILAGALLWGALVPALAGVRTASNVDVSLQNLQAIHAGLMAYGADWNDRQPTSVVDNFSKYGSNGIDACLNYYTQNGDSHPRVELGRDCSGFLWVFGLPNDGPQYSGGWRYLVPLAFDTSSSNFRLINAKLIHDYVGGLSAIPRWFAPTFYPPNDRAVYSLVQPWFAYPCEVSVPAYRMWSSYCRSPAAMFNPQVMRRPSQGGFRDPFSFSSGFASPAFSQAQYPSLKTHVLEHHWNQNAPARVCIPSFPNGPYSGCQPYFFNAAEASEPAALFYDGSTRLLPNTEVIAADAKVLSQTGGVDGLWHRGTPFGPKGYYGQYNYDGTYLAHHILTTDGILGRDTLP